MQAARGATLSIPRASPVLFLAIGVGITGYALDQLTKYLAIAHLNPGEPVPLIGSWLQLSLYRNPGAAFGMGTSFTVALSLFAMAALATALIVGLPRVRTRPQGLGLGLLIAGVTGNLHDRLLREPSPLQGHVIDFLQLKYFAIFNVADMCITAAALLMVWWGFTDGRKPEDDSLPAAEYASGDTPA